MDSNENFFRREAVGSCLSVNKKTKPGNSLALDGTLSSLLTFKMADIEPCFKWEPSQSVIKAAKSATSSYGGADENF